jgi:hypothetical protein
MTLDDMDGFFKAKGGSRGASRQCEEYRIHPYAQPYRRMKAWKLAQVQNAEDQIPVKSTKGL